MTLRATAVLGVALAAATLLTGCYYPTPQPAYTYYPPGCVSNAPPANSAPPADPSEATPAPAAPPCQLVPSYGYAYPAYGYPYPYYPGYYGYPGYAYPGYVYPPVSVGVGARFRL